MTSFESQPVPRSPLDNLGISLTETERAELLNRLEQRALDEAEDDQPASQPSYEDPREYLLGDFWD